MSKEITEKPSSAGWEHNLHTSPPPTGLGQGRCRDPRQRRPVRGGGGPPAPVWPPGADAVLAAAGRRGGVRRLRVRGGRAGLSAALPPRPDAPLPTGTWDPVGHQPVVSHFTSFRIFRQPVSQIYRVKFSCSFELDILFPVLLPPCPRTTPQFLPLFWPSTAPPPPVVIFLIFSDLGTGKGW